jgi:hypothetical protein
MFNQDVYTRRFTAERSFAWVDKFRALLVRYDRRDIYFLSGHYIAFAMRLSVFFCIRQPLVEHGHWAALWRTDLFKPFLMNTDYPFLSLILSLLTPPYLGTFTAIPIEPGER